MRMAAAAAAVNARCHWQQLLHAAACSMLPPGKPQSAAAHKAPANTPPKPQQDPIFKGNRVPNLEPGYPGGIFDPLGFSKGNMKELQTKEVKNGRLAMIAFMGFVVQVRLFVLNALKVWKDWRVSRHSGFRSLCIDMRCWLPVVGVLLLA